MGVKVKSLPGVKRWACRQLHRLKRELRLYHPLPFFRLSGPSSRGGADKQPSSTDRRREEELSSRESTRGCSVQVDFLFTVRSLGTTVLLTDPHSRLFLILISRFICIMPVEALVLIRKKEGRLC